MNNLSFARNSVFLKRGQIQPINKSAQKWKMQFFIASLHVFAYISTCCMTHLSGCILPVLTPQVQLNSSSYGICLWRDLTWRIQTTAGSFGLYC